MEASLIHGRAPPHQIRSANTYSTDSCLCEWRKRSKNEEVRQKGTDTGSAQRREKIPILEPRIISDELSSRPDISAIAAILRLELIVVAALQVPSALFLSETIESAFNRKANTKIVQHREYCAKIPGDCTVQHMTSAIGACLTASSTYIEQLADLVVAESIQTRVGTKPLTFQMLAFTMIHDNVVYLTWGLTGLHVEKILQPQNRNAILARTQSKSRALSDPPISIQVPNRDTEV